MHLSNGRAWAGFEYPMNGKILKNSNIEVDSRFRKSIQTDEMFKEINRIKIGSRDRKFSQGQFCSA